MKILLKTTYPCLVSTATEKQTLSEEDLLEIENENFLSVYPLQPNAIPFCIDLTAENNSTFYSYLNINNQSIILLENQQDVEILQKETLNFAGKICKVEISKNTLSFENDKTCIKLKIAHKTNDYKLSKIKNHACLQFENDLYLFDMSKSKLSHINAEKIQVEGQSITATKKFHDSLNREKQSIYTIDDNIILKKEEFMRTASTQQIKELNPYKFIESIKAKDFQFAVDLLSLQMKDKIDETKLQSFFGTVSTFLPLSECEFIVFSNGNKRFVKFDMVNDKINDIVIDEL